LLLTRPAVKMAKSFYQQYHTKSEDNRIHFMWRLVLQNMAGGQRYRDVIIKSAGLAVPAAILAIPYFYFLLYDFPRQSGPDSLQNAQALLWGQTAMIFVICLLSGFAGSVFTRRLDLPGLGDIRRWKKEVPYLAAAGLALMLFIYLTFDRYFYAVSPGSYPDLSLYMVLLPLKGSFTEELILRYGLVTIAVGICRNRYGGAALVAGFATILSLEYFEFAGIPLAWNYVCIMQLILAFLANLILGAVFVTRGLLAAMTIKLMLEMRYAVAAVFL